MNVKIYEDGKLVFESNSDIDNWYIELEQRDAHYRIDGEPYAQRIRVHSRGGADLEILPQTVDTIILGPR